MQQEQARTQYPDYGLAAYGLAGTDGEEPIEFATYGFKEFGAYSPILGIYSNDSDRLMFEVDDSDTDAYTRDGEPLVRTKMLELSPEDWQHFRATGQPRPNSVALGDDGTVYQYQVPEGMGWGFFKKLFKKIKKGVGKVIKKVKGVAKKIIKALPGGKYLLKIYGKIRAVAMKLVRPLMKFVGKYAAKLAPIAALIPGYGTAIAAALYTAGKIAKIMTKMDVVLNPKTGTPKFKSPAHGRKFQHILKLHAEHAKKTGLVAREMARAKARRGKPTERKHAPRTAPEAVRPFIPVSFVSKKFKGRILAPGTPAHSAYLRGLGATEEIII